MATVAIVLEGTVVSVEKVTVLVVVIMRSGPDGGEGVMMIVMVLVAMTVEVMVTTGIMIITEVRMVVMVVVPTVIMSVITIIINIVRWR